MSTIRNLSALKLAAIVCFALAEIVLIALPVVDRGVLGLSFSSFWRYAKNVDAGFTIVLMLITAVLPALAVFLTLYAAQRLSVLAGLFPVIGVPVIMYIAAEYEAEQELVFQGSNELGSGVWLCFVLCLAGLICSILAEKNSKPQKRAAGFSADEDNDW